MPRVCTCCTHPEKEAINRSIVDRLPFRTIAARFGTSATAVFRHKDHLPKVLVKAHEAREVAEGTDLLERLEGLRHRTMVILDQAQAAGDLRTALAAVREARGCLELLGKATGELAEKHAHLHVSGPVPAGVWEELSQSLRALTRQRLHEAPAFDDHLLEAEAALPASRRN